MVSQLNVAVHVLFKRVDRLREELCDVPTHLEEECVSKSEGTLNQCLVLLILCYDLGVAWIRSQVYCQRDQLFTNDRFRTMDYQLVHQRDALGVGESRLQLVFLTQMVQKLEDQSAVARSLEDIDQLGNQAIVVYLVATLFVER